LGNHRNFIRHKLYKEVSEEVTGGWRNLHNEELLHWYSSINIKVIRSRMMRWVEKVHE